MCCRQVFVSLEIIGGKIRGSVNSGAGVVALQSTQSVNDGRWHRVRYVLLSTFFFSDRIFAIKCIF